MPPIKLAPEEKLIIRILFRKKLRYQDFLNINFEKFIRIGSEHLVLPTIYINLKIKSCLNLIPKDLKNYLSEIYEINRNRNIKMIEEIKYISSLFKDNQIDYKLIKGSALITDNKYEYDIGERMVGDIDIIVNKKDLKKANNTLNQNGYINKKLKYYFWIPRHVPRHVNPNKLFAIELHHEVLRVGKRNIFRGENLFLNKKITPNDIENVKISILSYQLNDFGLEKLKYSYKTSYDVFKVLTKDRNKFFEIIENYTIKKFFIVNNMLGTFNFKIKMKFSDKIYEKRFLMKRKYRYYRILERIFSDLLILIPRRTMQLIEMIINPSYRRYVVIKFKRNKSILKI